MYINPEIELIFLFEIKENIEKVSSLEELENIINYYHLNDKDVSIDIDEFGNYVFINNNLTKDKDVSLDEKEN